MPGIRFKNLERFRTGGTTARMELSIPLPKTPDGRVYRYSPNERALPRHFVQGAHDETFVVNDAARKRMKLEPGSEQTVCPYSGVIGDDEDFMHPDDHKAAMKIFEHAADADVENAISGIFRDMERNLPSSKFFSVKAVRNHSIPKPRPRFVRRDLMRELVCDHCGCDYGVFAIGLFCPGCGAPNLRLHFAREVEIVRQQIELADGQEAQEELAYRLMGNAHEDVLTAFEATLKALYLYGCNAAGIAEIKAVGNDFQNVERAQKRFQELAFDPFATLTDAELSLLKVNIQKRHILGHNLGIMDERFALLAGGAKVGETVHLVGEDIRQFAALAQRIVDKLDAWLTPEMPEETPISPNQTLTEETQMALGGHSGGNASNLDLSPLAIRVGTWIAQHSENGLPSPVDGEALQADLADIDVRELHAAVAELASAGYLTTSPTLGTALPRMRATLDLFADFDPIAELGDPVADSLDLAERVLSGQDSVGVAALHQQTGWPIRRFNPAAGLVVARVDERRVSQELQSEYPTRHFHLMADDRESLRLYLANFTR